MPSPQTSTTQAPVISKQAFLGIFTVVFLPMFLAAVDQTLLAVATPAIVKDLGNMQAASWIAIGYLLAGAASVPIHGWLGDRFGRRKILNIALSIFAVGSLIGALAPSMNILITARIIQGLGGGGLMSLSQSLIGELLPPRQRARFQGYFSSLFAIASISGPIIGGIVVNYLSWQWLFWVNIPLTIIAIYRLRKLPPATTEQHNKKVDWWGLLLFPSTTTACIYWLSSGGHSFAWGSSTSLILLAGIVVLASVFILQQKKTTTSFLPLALLVKKEIHIPLISTFLFASCMFALVFFLPIYLQIGLGTNAAVSGFLLLPLTAGMISGAYTTGKIIAHTGVPKWVPVIGMSLTTLGFVLLGTLPPSSYLTGCLGLLCGLGMGTIMPSTQILIQTVAGKPNLGRITAMASLSRALGASVGTALFGAITYAQIPGFNVTSSIDSLLNAPQEIVIHAFHTGFLVAGAIAFLTVLNAARAPRLHLDDYKF